MPSITPGAGGLTTPGGVQSDVSDWWCAPKESSRKCPSSGRTVVISDIHIGNGAPTCWYQSSVHDPYLGALLDYVIAHAGGLVTRLVILGDLFDFWTYPPDQMPPTIDEIIEANPHILGRDGKLAKAIQALKGNAVYFRGNHDIGVTQEDLDRLPLGEYPLPLSEDIVVDDTGVLLTHGHHFTMFNAPDPRYPDEVPVGHFVTRAIAHMLENKLAPGHTAAELPYQGSPYGFDLSSFAPALLAEIGGPSISSILLDYFADRCGLSETTPIVMADGSSTTIRDAKAKYDGLWDDWVERYGGGEIGETVATKAVRADYNGDYMAWFAQKTAWGDAARGAVTGHTHVPRQGIENSSCLYLNCGFECPTVPDPKSGVAPGAFNFGVIEADGTPSLWCVIERDGTYCVGRAGSTEDTLVPGVFPDFSCYVTVTNSTSEALERTTATVDSGYYVVQPPLTIEAGNTARFWVQDLLGGRGAEGACTYAPAGGGDEVKLVYGCPTGFFSNYASGGTSFVANSTSPPTASQPRDSVPYWGHPLYVDFEVGGDAGSGEWAPRSVLAYAVVAAGFWYDPKQDIIFSRMDPLQRAFGYAYGYDAAALAMNSIIDCEPIFFDYNGKTWMIELWKGQYGLETGCEIGVYNRPIGSSSVLYSLLDATVGKRPNDPVPSHGQFFDAVGNDELLLMSSKLSRKGEELLTRGPEKHWWLTGFKWGVLSDPSDLTMDVSIECLDAVMTSAFAAALTTMGYQKVKTNGNTVTFTFDTPKTPQPRTDTPALVSVVEAANEAIVTAYDGLGLTSNDPNTVGDQAAATIGHAFAIYTEEFFLNVIGNLAHLAGIAVADVIHALSNDFNVAVAAISQFVTNAGYTLSSWVAGIGNFISEAFDYSCIVEISNRGGPYELELDGFGAGHGDWAVEPPSTIPAGGVGRCWLNDHKPSIDGSDGWADYAYVDSGGNRQTVRFGFSDPTGTAWNYASRSSGDFNLYTKSGDVNSGWSTMNSIITGGHPFFVAFVWGNAPLPSDA